jgi:riboflavin kinase/FMN adenylyltransferase
MKIFRSFDDAGIIRNPVVTTGSFDGVHIGHKTILKRLKTLAQRYSGESVLITFEPHPRKVLYPETAGKDLKLITSQEEKLTLLEEAGLDNVIIIEFTLAFSRITSEEFVRDFLYEKLHAKVVVAGFNHHFGFNKEGDYHQLWSWQDKYNFEAEEIPEQEVYHETVSSTRIREAVSEGYIQRANAYLDHYYIVIGQVEEFFPAYPNLPDFLRVRITDECKLLPPSGIYAVSCEGDGIVSKAMTVIQNDQKGSAEVLVHNFDQNPERKISKVRLSFHKRIHSGVNLSNDTCIASIRTAMNEISELIY